MLSRIDNWEHELNRFVQENQRRSFQYGQFDCCLFVADAIQSITGVDIAAAYRGRYQTRKEAIALAIEIAGVPSIQAVVDNAAATFEIPEIEPLRAGRGDMVLLRRASGRDYSLSVVALNGRELLWACKDGIGRISLESGHRAWRV